MAEAVYVAVAKNALKEGSDEALVAAKKALETKKTDEASFLCVSAMILAGDLAGASKMATDLVKSSSNKGRAKLCLAEVLLAQDKASDALKTAEEAKAAFDDSEGSVDASLVLCKSYLKLGQNSEAMEAAQNALTLANSESLSELEAKAWVALMTVRFAFGAKEDAISAAYAAIGIYGELEDELGEAVVLKTIAESMVKAKLRGEALPVASSAQEKFKELGCKAGEAAALEIVVECMVGAGQAGEAVTIAKKGCVSLKGSKKPEVVGAMALMTACLAAKSTEATDVGKDALALAKSGKMGKVEAQVSLLLCKSCASAGDFESAKSYGDSALTLMKGLGDSAGEADAKEVMAAVEKGVSEAPAKQLEKEMKARAQREMELELVKEAAALVADEKMEEFSAMYSKLEEMEYVTPEEVAAIFDPVMELNSEWIMTKLHIESAAKAKGFKGTKLEGFHRTIAYMFHRLGGMGYGPRLRCVSDPWRDIPNHEFAAGCLNLYMDFQEDEWEGVMGYHPNILDASLQVQSGFSLPTFAQGGTPNGITEHGMQAA